MEGNPLLSLVNLGVAGYMVWWFTQRAEKKFDGLSRSLNLLAQAVSLVLLNVPQLSDEARRQSDDIRRRIDSAPNGNGQH